MSHNNSSAPTDQFLLSILYFNARSILPKIDILRAQAATRKPLVICIVESWLSHDISDDELNINGYQIHRLDRNRHGGGVLVYTHMSLLYKYLPAGHSELELISISPHSPGNHCISVLYRPPSSTVSFLIIFHPHCINCPLIAFLVLYSSEILTLIFVLVITLIFVN